MHSRFIEDMLCYTSIAIGWSEILLINLSHVTNDWEMTQLQHGNIIDHVTVPIQILYSRAELY